MMLLIDVGNTRIKWASYEVGELGLQRAEAHATWTLSDVHRHITASVTRPQRVIACNVAGPRMVGLLTDAALQAWGVQPTFVHSAAAAAGVRNAYSEPAKLGADRWAGMVAAHNNTPGAVCVVSIGTAMTIDGIAADGQHLGGLITPGPVLMMQSLLGATSDIAARFADPSPTDQLFSVDTANAVRNGIRHALAALVVRASEWAAARTASRPSVVLTGGGCSLVEPLLPWPCKVVPDLVLRGLAILAATM